MSAAPGAAPAARLFAALELPAAIRAALGAFGGAAAERDRALRPVRDADLHVTLVFLGHRPATEIAAATEAVAGAASGVAAPELELGAPLWLAPRRPHVLTVQLGDPSGALAALQSAVAGALAQALGIAPETRPFRPHVTVARVRRGAAPRRARLPAPSWEPGDPFTGEAVALVRSHLGGGPARYESLLRVPLVAKA